MVKHRIVLCLMLVAIFAATTCSRIRAQSGGDGFPLTLTSAAGTATIPHRPARIVSLSPTATEDLFAVGAGAQVVAVDSYSTFPANAPVTKLTAFDPNIEAIANYKPDLVVVSDDTNHVTQQVAKLGIPVLMEPTAKNLADAYAQIQQIARATGHTHEGASVIAGIRSQIAQIVGAVPSPSKPLAVYHELDQTFYSADSHTFIGEIYSMMGVRNIADEAHGSTHYPQLSAEFIIAADPNLVVLADTVCCGQTGATVAKRPGWNRISAVKDGAVVPVNDSIASEWGPRIVLFVKAVADAVKALEERAA